MGSIRIPDEAIERIQAGERYADIAASYGVSTSAVSQFARQRGARRYQHAPDAHALKRAVVLWANGAPRAEILALGVTIKAVRNAALRAGLRRGGSAKAELRREQEMRRALTRERSRAVRRAKRVKERARQKVELARKRAEELAQKRARQKLDREREQIERRARLPVERAKKQAEKRAEELARELAEERARNREQARLTKKLAMEGAKTRPPRINWRRELETAVANNESSAQTARRLGVAPYNVYHATRRLGVQLRHAERRVDRAYYRRWYRAALRICPREMLARIHAAAEEEQSRG